MSSLSPRGKTILLSVLLSLAIIAVLGLNLSRGGLQHVIAQQTSEAIYGPPEAPLVTSSTPQYASSAMSIVKMLAALAIVIACIYGGLHLLKKSMTRLQRGAGSGKMIEVLETQYVGPKKAVSLVRVGNRAVLLGMTDTNINVLTELAPDEMPTATPLAQQTAPTDQTMGFTAALKKAAGETMRSFRLKRAAVESR